MLLYTTPSRKQRLHKSAVGGAASLCNHLAIPEAERYDAQDRQPRRTNINRQSARIGLVLALLLACAPARAAELIVFTRGVMNDIGPNDRPKPAERVKSVSLYALRGEYEPFTFAVHNDGGAPLLLTARSAPLYPRRADRLRPIPASCVEVRGLKRGAKFRWRRTGDWVLDRAGEASTGPGANARFWATVHVPPNAAPGDYDGKVTIAAGDQSAVLKIVLHVAKAELRDVPGVKFYLLGTVSPYGQYHRWVKPAQEKALRPKVVAFYRELKQHGMTGICIKTSDFPYREGKIPGLIAEAEAAKEAGLTGPIVWNMLALIDAAKGGDRYDFNGRMDNWDEKKDLARLRVLHALATAEAKKRGWPEIIYCPIDEPGTQYENRSFLLRSMDILLKTTRELKKLGVRCHSTISEPVDDKHNRAPRWSKTPDEMRKLWDKCRPTLSVRNYGYGYPQGKTDFHHEMRDAKKRGHEVWTYYNAAVMGRDRRCARICFGLWGWRAKLDAVTAWTYPGGRTVQFEMVREGIDDHKAIAVLESLIKNRKGNEADRRAAQKFLHDLGAAIQLDKNGFISNWPACAKAVRLDTLKQRLITHIDKLAD